MITKKIIIRFWSKVQKTNNCWIWLTGKRKGYGVFCANYKTLFAHRFSWELYFGAIPKDLHVLHKCDNRACVNPDHLFLGTQKDNINDMVEKNRQAKGENHGESKLTEKQVLKIRELYSRDDISQRKLAKKFKITQTMIGYIVNKQSWKHLK